MSARPIAIGLALTVAAASVTAAVRETRGPHWVLYNRVQPPPPSPSLSPTPAPTITVIRSGRVLAAGLAANVDAQPGVSLRVAASRPRVSRTRLSSDYGYPPARGFYVTFVVTIVNTGREPVAIGPANFRVRIPGEGTVRSNDGNAPYSGASAQLDTTQLDPGQTLRGPLTFDVRRPHGSLSYLPDETAAVTWRF